MTELHEVASEIQTMMIVFLVLTFIYLFRFSFYRSLAIVTAIAEVVIIVVCELIKRGS